MSSTRLLFGLALALVTSAQAHDLWVEREGTLSSLHYGHRHSGHEGTKELAYKPEILKAAACFGPAGQVLPAAVRRGQPITLEGDCAASWFLTSSGYWSKTPYGTRNVPKTEATAVLDSWLSVEAVKRIDAWGEALSRPVTQELEIVPLGNPLRLRSGDKLRLAVTLGGKPAAGVTVAYFGHPRGTTDGDGRINIRLQQPGLQLIQASRVSPLDDGKADKLIQATALQFGIAP